MGIGIPSKLKPYCLLVRLQLHPLCQRGGTGRRIRLKTGRPHGHGSSILPVGTWQSWLCRNITRNFSDWASLVSRGVWGAKTMVRIHYHPPSKHRPFSIFVGGLFSFGCNMVVADKLFLLYVDCNYTETICRFGGLDVRYVR